MATYQTNVAFKGIDRVSNAFINMGRSATKFRSKATGAFKSASKQGSMFGAVLGGNLVSGAITKGFTAATFAMKSFVTEASKVEDATAAFTPLMGGVKGATKLVSELNKTAASTPFQFDNISASAKQLLPVMNQDIEKTIKTFRMLGDTAGGNAQKLDSITRGFTKAMLKGKPDMEALNMIAEAGVPIFTEMAKSMGLGANGVQKLFERSKKGLLTSKDLTKTFEDMTAKGGIFYKGMEIASKTLTGKISTLKDNIGLAVGTIGLQFFPILKKLADKMISLASNVRLWVVANKELIKTNINNFIKSTIEKLKSLYQISLKVFSFIKTNLPIIKAIASAFVIWKVATIGVTIAMNAMAIIGTMGKIMQFTKIIFAITKAKSLWTAAQWALNVAMNANPIGLITLGVAALIGLGVLLYKNWDKVKGLFIGLGNVFRSVGALLFDTVLSPIKMILFLLAKIPGVGGIAQLALDKIHGATAIIKGDQKTETQAPPRALEKGKTVGGSANINFTAPSGFGATVDNDTLQAVSVSQMGLNG